MNLKTHYTIPVHVMLQKVDNDTILLNTQTGLFFALNPMGEIMWELLKEHTLLQNVHAQMLLEFDVSAEQLKDDIIAFAQALYEQDLLNITD